MPSSDSGTATLGMKVAAALRRKRKITRTTSATAMVSVNSMSCTELRIVVVRSFTTDSFIEPGIEAWNSGSSSRMRSTVPIMFAPGWRKMIISTAGLLLNSAALRTSSTESKTLATWSRRTGAPLR